MFLLYVLFLTSFQCTFFEQPYFRFAFLSPRVVCFVSSLLSIMCIEQKFNLHIAFKIMYLLSLKFDCISYWYVKNLVCTYDHAVCLYLFLFFCISGDAYQLHLVLVCEISHMYLWQYSISGSFPILLYLRDYLAKQLNKVMTGVKPDMVWLKK